MKYTADSFIEGEVLLFNKPLYWTSFDLVNKVRNIIRNRFGIKKIKVGHAGTLDPLASGLVIICTGKATKRISRIQESGKRYIASFHMGKTTPSFDLETEVDKTYDTSGITLEKVEEAVEHFQGEQLQVPPVFSAKNIKGKRAYEYARKGIEVELPSKKITISNIKILKFDLPVISLSIDCSTGTYIRALARDFGEYLDCGAYLEELKRISIGNYELAEAVEIDGFEKILEQV